MDSVTAKAIGDRLTVAAASLKLANELLADSLAGRVRAIRDALSTGDDSTAWAELTAVLDELRDLSGVPPHATSKFAERIEKQTITFRPGVERAIDQIEKAIKQLPVAT